MTMLQIFSDFGKFLLFLEDWRASWGGETNDSVPKTSICQVIEPRNVDPEWMVNYRIGSLVQSSLRQTHKKRIEQPTEIFVK